jgi:maltooligosyltrehalose trehalohydrolase
MNRFGAIPVDDGVRFAIWAPNALRLVLHLKHGSTVARYELPASSHAGAGPDALRAMTHAGARAGDRYAYSLDGHDPLPDPASRFQPDGVHGWSEIIDPAAFEWTDSAWPGLDPRRLVIYELHVGTFTPDGTFRAAIDKLPYLRDLGITAVELMPVADFAGRRNWGYDGVALFAPSRAYGRPDDLRALADAAHRTGLGVILDVVYNHVGPDGAYLPSFSPQFLTRKHETPWGDAVNLDDEGSATVRRLLIENATHWIGEYHVDGLRLDATHALIDTSDRHFLQALADAVHASRVPPRARPPLLFAEDHRNLSTLVEDRSCGGWGFDGVWADDFHHVVRRMLAGDDYGYYVDYRGEAAELASTLSRGWLYTGQHSAHQQKPRGTDPARVEMRKSVICVQNHDQIGNRAFGDRLNHSADPAAWRAAIAVLLTAPMTPLLFMGQEWGASTPFLFFTDFGADLGARLIEGRRREFQAFPAFAAPERAARIPNPQADATFEMSRLNWGEVQEPPHLEVLTLHRALLRLRAERASLHASDALAIEARALDDDTVAFRRGAPGELPLLVVSRLRGRGPVCVPELSRGGWQPLLDTEDVHFAPDPRPADVDAARGAIDFQRPGALIFEEQP